MTSGTFGGQQFWREFRSRDRGKGLGDLRHKSFSLDSKKKFNDGSSKDCFHVVKNAEILTTKTNETNHLSLSLSV